MSKYDSIKILKKTKSRIPHTCNKCGRGIKAGDIYYPESIGKVNAPGIKLRKYCEKCYNELGEGLLK